MYFVWFFILFVQPVFFDQYSTANVSLESFSSQETKLFRRLST